MSNLSLRLISGSVYVLLMVLAAVFGHPWLAISLSIITFLGLNEISTIAGKNNNQHQFINPLFLSGILLYAAVFLKRELSLNEIIGALVAQQICVVVLRHFLSTKSQVEMVSGTLYTWLPLLVLALVYPTWADDAAIYLLFYFITIWGYDSLAYSTGKMIGKTPVFPKISPKKTVEGTVGGILLTVTAMYLVNRYGFKLPINAVVVSGVTILFAIAGDFNESYLKRKLGIKDSGTIIPGHGGVLDRIDSIYYSAIPYVILVAIL